MAVVARYSKVRSDYCGCNL